MEKGGIEEPNEGIRGGMMQGLIKESVEEPIKETVEEFITGPIEKPIEEPITGPIEEPMEETIEEPIEGAMEEPRVEEAIGGGNARGKGWRGREEKEEVLWKAAGQ